MVLWSTVDMHNKWRDRRLLCNCVQSEHISLFLLVDSHYIQEKACEVDGKKQNTALSVCNVVLVCAFQPCCTDSCQWQSDASQRAHAIYYARWTGHDIVSRLTSCFLIGQTVITYIFLWKYFTAKAWTEQVSTQKDHFFLRQTSLCTCNMQSSAQRSFWSTLGNDFSIIVCIYLFFLREPPIWQCRSAVG